LLRGLERAFNRIWHTTRARHTVFAVVLYLAALTLLPLFLAINITIGSALLHSGLFHWLPLSDASRWLVFSGSYLFSAGVFAFLYKTLPNCTVHWKAAWAGGCVTAALFEIAKILLSLYFLSIPTYKLLYGSLVIIPIFMCWIDVAWLIVLFGSAISWAIHHRAYE
jgi:membrane protein